MRHRYWNRAIEQASRVDLLAVQWERLEVILEYAYIHNPMYRDRWDAAGVRPGAIRSIEQFRHEIPFVTKQDFMLDQETRPPFGRRASMDPERWGQIYLTSGTSGQGQEVHVASDTDLESSARALAYQLWWAGVSPGDRIVVTLPVGLPSGGLSVRRACESYGLVSLMLGQYDSATKIEVMRKFSPQALVCTPSYLTRLHAVGLEEGLDPGRDLVGLKVILLCGEPYDLKWACMAEEYWGARLSEWYGCSQAGEGHMIACELGVHQHQGRQRGVLHNLEHRVLAEVIDPESGEHVAPGEKGEVVITNLHRSLLMVRFRTNDCARYLGETPCECGRPLSGIESGTVTRYDDMIKIRGLNVWPESVDKVLFSRGGVADYRARVFVDDSGRESVTLEVEFASHDEVDEALLLGGIENEIKHAVGIHMHVVSVVPGTIPKAAFKARRWHDERRSLRSDGVVLQGTT